MKPLHLKANSRGSWTNVLSFDPEHIAEVKASAHGLAIAADCSVSFKITDDQGITLHSLDARHDPIAWHDRTH